MALNRVQSLKEIKEILSARGLAPRHSLGQNFLIDQNLLRKLVASAGVGIGDLVLEVGPGTGTLTDVLLESGCDVIACELDRGLSQYLREVHGPNPRFTLIEGDCLTRARALNESVAALLADRDFTLVANLPYGAATPLIVTLLKDHPRCASLHMTVQREVGDRLRAAPGSRDYGPLSVLASYLSDIEVVANAPPECFWPRPEVQSVMLSLRRRIGTPPVPPARLFEVAVAIFSNRRKQVGRALSGLGLSPIPDWIDPTQRAEDLPPELIVRVAAAVRGG